MAFYYRAAGRGYFVFLRLIDGDIIQSEALKVFQFRVSHLFTKPPIEELIEDKVYYDFVIPAYRTIKLRAEAAKKNAEKEKRRADSAEKKAEAARKEAEEEKIRADSAEKKAEEEKMRADSAEKKAEAAKKEAEYEKIKAERLAEKLRSLGISPD